MSFSESLAGPAISTAILQPCSEKIGFGFIFQAYKKAAEQSAAAFGCFKQLEREGMHREELHVQVLSSHFKRLQKVLVTSRLATVRNCSMELWIYLSSYKEQNWTPAIDCVLCFQSYWTRFFWARGHSALCLAQIDALRLEQHRTPELLSEFQEAMARRFAALEADMKLAVEATEAHLQRQLDLIEAEIAPLGGLLETSGQK